MKKRKTIIILISLLAVVLLPLVVPLFVPWSEINCRHQDINIKTGQARFSRILWFIKISEHVKDTPLCAGHARRLMSDSMIYNDTYVKLKSLASP